MKRMTLLKINFLILMLFLFGSKMHAQHLWYENETNTENTLFTGTQNGTFSINETNPDISIINSNTLSSKFVRNANENRGFSYFELPQPILTDAEYTISLKAYIDVTTVDLALPIDRLRVYLKNTTTGESIQKQQLFTAGQEWQEFSFVFSAGDLPAAGFNNGGYNQMYIGYGNGQQSTPAVTYYIDEISGSKQQQSTTDVLQGSWGGRLYVRGGEDLDTFVAPVLSGGNGYDYIAGAQEIVNNFPTMGHVMTNATNNANAQLWTLRTNPNVDEVMNNTPNSIVDEEFVPSLANEQIIIDVINIFKNANKKVILYLNSQSPANRATPNGSIAWNNYVDTYFAGNGHAAWMNYCEGYIKRFTALGVDGYWIDSFGSYNVNDSLGANDVPSTTAEKNEFVQMIRNIAPYATITTNFDKAYIEDSNGKNLKVDTDEIIAGVEIDGNTADYRVIKMEALDPWSDYTAGHITPLATGAPPNSWAYEEFTVTDIEQSSISSYNGTKQTVKHLFLPIRATWSGIGPNSPLLFDGEQAYRFVKRITDVGGSVTFSNTTADGTIQGDEHSVLTFVNQQLAINAEASVYQRPFGAFLVGENQTLSTTSNELDDLSLKIYPNPVKNSFEMSKSFSSVSVYSVTGQKVLDFNSNQTNFDVSKLNSGLYLLKANDSEGNSQVIRFIKK